jgi:chaperonin GroES
LRQTNVARRKEQAVKGKQAEKKAAASKLKPLGDKVVVKRLEAETKTKGGIVLPDTAKEKPKRGKVLAIGEGKRLDSGELVKPAVKVGDEVIFSSFAGTEITVGDEEVLIMGQDDILAVLKA